jgi:hypothetical protein
MFDITPDASSTLRTWEELLTEVPSLYEKYLDDNPWALSLEARIQEQVRSHGFLSRADMKEIFQRMGNAHSRWQQLFRHNSEEHVREVSGAAITVLDEPGKALTIITSLDTVGESFGSKVLAFMAPETCAVWDRVVRQSLLSTTNTPRTYDEFIALLMGASDRISLPNPRRPYGRWLVRDIEAGFFQFSWPAQKGGNGGRVVGTLPR